MNDDRTPPLRTRPATGTAGDTRCRTATRLEWVIAGAGLLMAAGGCALTSSPPRRPIDGLRTVGHAEPSQPTSTATKGELPPLDLRFVGNE